MASLLATLAMIVQPVWAGVNCCCRAVEGQAESAAGVPPTTGCPHCHVSLSSPKSGDEHSNVGDTKAANLLAGGLPCEPDRCPRCACDQDLQSAIMVDSAVVLDALALPAMVRAAHDSDAAVSSVPRRLALPPPVRNGRDHCVRLERWLI